MPEFYTRPATLNDFEPVYALVHLHWVTDYQNETSFSPDDLQQVWASLNLETETCVVMDHSGQIVGHGWFPARMRDDLMILDPQFFVLPDLREQGAEKLLIEAAEKPGQGKSEGKLLLQPMVTNSPARLWRMLDTNMNWLFKRW